MSRWLEEHEKELDAFRASRKKNFPIILGTLGAVIGFFALMAILNSSQREDVEISQVLMPIIIFAVIILFTLVLSSKMNNKKGDKHLRKNLEEILKSSEETALFDHEMSREPACRIQLKKDDGDLYFTPHFLVRRLGHMPFIHYSIFKLSDIRSTKTLLMRDHTSLLNLDKEYMTNLCMDNRKVLGGVTLKGQEAYEAFMSALCEYVPHIKLEEGE